MSNIVSYLCDNDEGAFSNDPRLGGSAVVAFVAGLVLIVGEDLLTRLPVLFNGGILGVLARFAPVPRGSKLLRLLSFDEDVDVLEDDS